MLRVIKENVVIVEDSGLTCKLIHSKCMLIHSLIRSHSYWLQLTASLHVWRSKTSLIEVAKNCLELCKVIVELICNNVVQLFTS